MNLRDQILSGKALKSTIETITALDAAVEIREMTAQQRLALAEKAREGELDKDEVLFELADMLICAAHDPDTGDPIFLPEDRVELPKKLGEDLERLAMIAADLSGISKKAAEDEEKNSDSDTREGASTSE